MESKGRHLYLYHESEGMVVGMVEGVLVGVLMVEGMVEGVVAGVLVGCEVPEPPNEGNAEVCCCAAG